MKLLELNIEAFGPFTQKQLIFSSLDSTNKEQGGLHLIYGKNEAGKSACLRALKSLLYGIPTRTPDNFLHTNNKLRISAKLEHSNGDTLFIRRRKGRLNTLLDEANNTLDDGVLAPYLQGLNQTLFETLFGLDHSALVQGGEAMLTQQGEVGQALFSAGMGIANLREILQDLEQEAKILYAPRGKKPEINGLMGEYKQCEKQIRQQSLSAPQWKKDRKQLDDLKRKLQTQSDQLKNLQQQSDDLKRLQTVHSLLVERDALQAKLSDLGDIPQLSNHFTTQRIQALKTTQDSQQQIKEIKLEQEQLSRKQSYIQLDMALLKMATPLESLQQKVMAYSKDQRELIEKQQQQSDLEAKNKQLLLFLSPELAQTAKEADDTVNLVQRLLPFFNKHKPLRTLAQQQTGLQNTLQHAEQQQKIALSNLHQAQQSLDELPMLYDTKALYYSIKCAREQGDLEQQRQDLMGDYEKQCADCKRDIQRLGLCCEDLNRLEVLPIPSMETVERFKKEFQKNHSYIEQYQQKKQDVQQRLQALEGQLKALTLSGEVPTEQALTKVRRQRQQMWQGIRDITLTSKISDDLQHKTTLLNAFEQQIEAVDQLADRLRRESERVHKQADLLAQKEINHSQLSEILVVLEQRLSEQTVLKEQWQVLWKETTLEPLPPKEMSAWLRRLQRLQDQVSELNQTLQRLDDFNQGYYEICRLIEESLHYTGGVVEGLKSSEYESIHWLLEQAEQRLETLRDTARDKDSLTKEMTVQNKTLSSEIEAFQQAQKAWDAGQQQWRTLLEPLGLSADSVSIEINELLDNVTAWFANQEELQKLTAKVQALEKEKYQFETAYQALQNQLTLDEVTDVSPDQWVKQQYKHLKQQQQQQNDLHNLEEKQQEKAFYQQQWQTDLDNSKKILDRLCQEAHCEQIEDLEAVEDNVKQAQLLQTELKHLQQRLNDSRGRFRLDELETQLQGYEEGKLDEELDGLEQKIEEQGKQRDQLHQESGRLGEQFHQSETQSGAVDSLDEKHAILAQMSDKVQTYLRQRLAQRMLQQYIERYRQQHQGPVLKRAGEYFATLSCDSFQGLGIDYDAKDQAILMGQRNDEEYINIEGMSDGTRDQLYLSLRLASLEQRVRNEEPLPFILDDILINFDNERALAGLNALSQLAQKTQVILFTHHQHMIDLFKQQKQQEQDFTVHVL
jgi:uncharacterized protein YhaN